MHAYYVGVCSQTHEYLISFKKKHGHQWKFSITLLQSTVMQSKYTTEIIFVTR